ncbi:family 2 glycosyl transferase [Alteromonas mediterranea 615]|uniref:Family 2 glycosyl transferase n=1 Tax=Alteromonas mediterranea 615 TaxID=1300253 RepID=S5AG47_9ALTE|nr:family 2 glycosyl transferase [Alteromonas mediterranea 615]
MEISAVIPCYNGEKFLEDAVESINQQTYLPKEIVIINDGSIDSSGDIIERLKESSRVEIKSISQANHGVSSARNVGIANASYEWVAFLDVDDIWLSTMLESKVNFARKHDGNLGLICCNYYVDNIDDSCEKHNGSINAKRAHDRLIKGTEFQSILLRENFIGTATTMMFNRHSALLIGGFDSLMKHSEEFDFILRLGCITDVAVLSEPLALKRHHGENLSDDKELYFYSHYFSCKKNTMYENKYSKIVFSKNVKKLMQLDLEKFATGYCNQVYEKNKTSGLITYIKFFFRMRTLNGLYYHLVGFIKKMIRTVSFNLLRKRT